MKAYCQFKTTNGEGHVADLLGSDGVSILDGRLNLESMINYCHKKVSEHYSRRFIVGFDIIKAKDFLDEGNVLYKTRF